MNENGVLSFDKPFRFSHPSRFPPKYIYARRRDIVAPFWSDNDIRKDGVVRYVYVEKGSSAKGDHLLGLVADHINKTVITENDRQFYPNWMVVAQWEKVHPYPHGAANHEGISEEYLSKVI